MKGIVSSIAFCPDYSGLYAASSLSGAITLLTEATGGDAVAYLDGMSGAITQVSSPAHKIKFQQIIYNLFASIGEIQSDASAPSLCRAAAF